MKDEKLTYIAPEAEIETVGQDDIVLISIVDGTNDLDDKSIQFSW